MLTITVCIGSSCHLKGSNYIIDELRQLIEENDLKEKVNIRASFCLDKCTGPVAVKINDGEIVSLRKENTKEFFNDYILKAL